MPKRKIVIDEKEGSVLMGVMKEGADPVTKTVPGTLEDVLQFRMETLVTDDSGTVTGVKGRTDVHLLLAEAEAKWAVTLRNPAYKPPAEPKPAPKPEPKPAPKAAPKSAPATKKAEELPLLADKPEAELARLAKAKAELDQKIAEEKAKVSEAPPAETPVHPVVKQALKEKAAAVAVRTCRVCGCTQDKACQTTEGPCHWVEQDLCSVCAPAVTQALDRLSQTPSKVEPAAAPVVAPAAPAAPAPVAAGQWEYRVSDGRGPFNSVQEAMDALGLVKGKRPAHNRWDRLSTELKSKIQRLERKS